MTTALSYRAILSNNYSAGDDVTSGYVGGLALENNAFGIPEEARSRLINLAAVSEHKSVRLWISIALDLEQDQITPKLRPHFERAALSTVPQKFRANDPLDQRPAVASNQLFVPLIALISEYWHDGQFETTQEGREPIVRVNLVANGSLADSILTLIGY